MRFWMIGFILVSCGGDTPGEDTVTTESGAVVGNVATKTRAFLGIPYAAPPVGSLRWKSPQPPSQWSQPLAAKKFAHSCAQLDNPFVTNLDFSEDCLTLNVWTPRPAPHGAPVMVFLHGGAFIAGAGGDSLYDGSKLAARGVVIVTVNYRLGPFGFLSGNFGIQDQRAALQWVKRNIAAFGGDPANVTLFGESAGGISVLLHLVSPPSAGLFQRAIVESGPIFSAPDHSFYWQTAATAQMHSDALMQALGCADIDCLRSKSADDVLNALPPQQFNLRGLAASAPWWPVVDGADIPAQPYALIQEGAFARVPVLLGTNKDEGTLFEKLLAPVTSDADYQAEVMAAVQAQAPMVLAQYPTANFPTAGDAASAVFGDVLFTCDARRVARALAAAGVPVYRYHFEHLPEMPFIANMGVHHAAEVLFLFGKNVAADEQPFFDQMQGFWTQFAQSGDPGGGWPRYDAATDAFMLLDTNPHAAQGVSTANCDFWDALPPG